MKKQLSRFLNGIDGLRDLFETQKRTRRAGAKVIAFAPEQGG
ncbi:MAG: hypothetical protein ACRD3L_03380 [Terriglobales bacterium]